MLHIMKNLFTLLLLVSTIAIAQTDFKKGYVIDNQNNKVSCYIEDSNWSQNPTEIAYKKTLDSEVIIATLIDIKEAVVEGSSKLVRAKVAIDRSTDNVSNLGFDSRPNFNEETVFLRVVVEGEATLYSYINKGTKRYFFSTSNKDIEQLVYKRYKVNGEKIAENNTYKQQLLSAFNSCETISNSTYQGLRYATSSLEKLFIKYNTCLGGEAITYDVAKYKKNLFRLKARVGVDNGSLDIRRSNENLNATFDNELNFSYGAEVEFRLPFKKSDHWTAYTGILFRKYSSETTIATSSPHNPFQDVSTTYNSFQIPIGLRYYFDVYKDVKLFLDASYIFDWPTDLKLAYSISGERNDESNVTTNSFGIGAGINYKRFDVSAIYKTKRNPYRVGSNGIDSDYSEVSFSLAYRIL